MHMLGPARQSEGIDKSKGKAVADESHRSGNTILSHVLTRDKSTLPPDMFIIPKGLSVKMNQPGGQNQQSQIASMVIAYNGQNEIGGSAQLFS